MVFYTNRFIPKQFAGVTRLFFIFLRPQYRGNKAMLEHEKVHVRQFWRGWLVWLILCAAAYAVVSNHDVVLSPDVLVGAPLLGASFHSLLYQFVAKYRLACEVEAYRRQLAYQPQSADLFAGFISTRYRLKISRDEVRALLLS